MAIKLGEQGLNVLIRLECGHGSLLPLERDSFAPLGRCFRVRITDHDLEFDRPTKVLAQRAADGFNLGIVEQGVVTLVEH